MTKTTSTKPVTKTNETLFIALYDEGYGDGVNASSGKTKQKALKYADGEVLAILELTRPKKDYKKYPTFKLTVTE